MYIYIKINYVTIRFVTFKYPKQDVNIEGGIKLIRKILVIGIILLLVSVGVQPVFADISIESQKSELEEVTIQFYETDRTYNHTVLLTQEQKKDLEKLINDFEIKLDNADNKIETEAVFKDTIVSLDNLGLLPKDISIDKAQRLVTGKEQDHRFVRIFERLFDSNKGSWEDDENFLCLISGSTDYTQFFGPIGYLNFHFIEIMSNFLLNCYHGFIFDFILPLLLAIYIIFFNPILFLGVYFWHYNPLHIGHYIDLGITFYNSSSGYEEFEPATGWVHTRGLNGEKIWNGSFYGILPILENMGFNFGVIGFTGIKILKNYSYSYLGSALWVKIKNTWW